MAVLLFFFFWRKQAQVCVLLYFAALAMNQHSSILAELGKYLDMDSAAGPKASLEMKWRVDTGDDSCTIYCLYIMYLQR